MVRVKAQNFVVVVRNIPDEIKTDKEFEEAIKPMMNDVLRVVCVPNNTKELMNNYESSTSLDEKSDKCKRSIEIY